jgi:hypothetical protein
MNYSCKTGFRQQVLFSIVTVDEVWARPVERKLWAIGYQRRVISRKVARAAGQFAARYLLLDNPFVNLRTTSKKGPHEALSYPAASEALTRVIGPSMTCRQVNGHIEIGAGHHRVRAAPKAGIKTADVFVGEFDDAAMIQVFATENATQPVNTSTAVACVKSEWGQRQNISGWEEQPE